MGGKQLLKLGGIASGVALGGGILSMLLGAGQRYVALSQILQVLEQRFRGVGAAAASWGNTIGITNAKAGGLLETLGGGTNTPDKGQFQALAGFAKWRGIDPSVSMDLGAAAGRRGAKYGTKEMLSLLGTAAEVDMSKGRLSEHMQAFGGLAEQSFSALGYDNPSAVTSAQRGAGMIFGTSDPRGQGQRGADFTTRLNGVLTGGGGMKSYMMRAMGFGGKDGPDYIAMRKRMEAGVFDPDNLTDLFGLMGKQGLNKGQMFRGVEAAAGGQLKAHEIEALVNTLGTQSGRDAYSAWTKDGDADKFAKAVEMTDEERAIFEKSGLLGLGKKGVSAGDRHELLMEGRTKEYGPKSLQIQDSLLRTGDALVGLLSKFIDGGMLLGLATAVEKLALAIERQTNPSALPDGMKDMNMWQQLGEIVNGGGGSDPIHKDAMGTKRLPGDLPDAYGGAR